MIKFLVMDVDGTLTDGKIYMGVDGECLKAFDVKDGYALHTLLKEYGIIPVIITARKSPMVEHRCKELGVTEIHQGVMNKVDCLKGIIEKYSSSKKRYDLSNVAYIGDDLLDLQCMYPIKEAGGLAGCPSNAAKEVIAVSGFISQYKGGEGAVRDFAEYIILKYGEQIKDMEYLQKRCQDAVAYLLNLQEKSLTEGHHNVCEGFFYNVQEYETDINKKKQYESHRKYVDIQLLVSGEELMQVTDVTGLRVVSSYDESKDCVFYAPNDNDSGIYLRPGSVLVLYPKDGHRSLGFGPKSCKVKKIVGKVTVEL